MIATLLMAAAPPPPVPPSHLKPIIMADDYPQSAADAGEEGPVAFEALIAPDGSVDKCTVIVSSRYAVLDAATCRIIQTRARFSPAEDASGKPIYGIFRNVITWSLGNVVSGALDPQLELNINQAPAGVKLPLVMTLNYRTKPDGTATDCKLADKSAGEPAVLADLACNAILAQPPEVITNSKGQPVTAQNNMVVRFSLGR